MTNQMPPHRFTIKRHGPKKFRWYLLAPGGHVLASGPGSGLRETKYLSSADLCRERIATIKQGASSWKIEETIDAW